MAPVIASTAAAAFLALAAIVAGSSESLLFLSLAAFLAYWSHVPEVPYLPRLAFHFGSMALGVAVWLYLVSVLLF